MGEFATPGYNFDTGEVFAKLSLDEFNNITFPTSGSSGSIEILTSSEALGADSPYDQVKFRFATAKTWGRHTITESGASMT